MLVYGSCKSWFRDNIGEWLILIAVTRHDVAGGLLSIHDGDEKIRAR